MLKLDPPHSNFITSDTQLFKYKERYKDNVPEICYQDEFSKFYRGDTKRLFSAVS